MGAEGAEQPKAAVLYGCRGRLTAPKRWSSARAVTQRHLKKHPRTKVKLPEALLLSVGQVLREYFRCLSDYHS